MSSFQLKDVDLSSVQASETLTNPLEQHTQLLLVIRRNQLTRRAAASSLPGSTMCIWALIHTPHSIRAAKSQTAGLVSDLDRWNTLRQGGNADAFRAMPAAMAGLFGVIGVERVDFVSVPTRDLARARRFYGEVLGLPRSRSNPDEFEATNVTLTPWQPQAQDVPFSPNTAGIALRVADVNVAREQLVANRVEFLGDTVDTGVCLMGFFYDPDGNVLILHRRYAPLED